MPAVFVTRISVCRRIVSRLALCATALAAVLLPSIAPAQIVKWNPGHYARITSDTPPITGTAEIGGVDISSPAITGVVIRMKWNQLESSLNDYSPLLSTSAGSIKDYLNFLAPLGKHLIIELRERNYGESDDKNNDAAPDYLQSYVIQGVNQSIWLPDYGDSYVVARYIALGAAIAAEFNDDPYFEGLQSGEQGTYAAYTGNSVNNSASVWRENFTLIAEGVKKKFTHTMFWAPTMNPTTNMNASQLTRIFSTAKAGQYIIDTAPHLFPNNTDGWNDYAAAHPNEFPVKANGEVGKWNSPSGTDDDNPDSYYQIAVNTLHAHHVAWTASPNSRLRSDWWDDVVPFLYNSGNILPTNTLLPASISGNMVANPGFEDALDVEWTPPDSPAQTQLTQQSGDAKSGTYALRAVANGSYAERVQAAIPVTVGTSYTISHSIRVDSVTGNGFSFKYDWLDDTGQVIGSTVSQDQGSITTGYLTKTVIDTAPTGAVTLRIRCAIRSSTSSGTAFFDDISVLRNLVLNAGFELALGSEWNGAASLSRLSGNAHSGSYALKAVATGSYGERAQVDIPVAAGQTYTIGGYIRVDSVTLPGFSIRYDWYDSSGGSVGTFGELIQNTVTSGYVQKTASVQAPTGAVTLKVRCIIKSTTTGTAYFDDISVY